MDMVVGEVGDYEYPLRQQFPTGTTVPPEVYSGARMGLVGFDLNT